MSYCKLHLTVFMTGLSHVENTNLRSQETKILPSDFCRPFFEKMVWKDGAFGKVLPHTSPLQGLPLYITNVDYIALFLESSLVSYCHILAIVKATRTQIKSLVSIWSKKQCQESYKKGLNITKESVKITSFYKCHCNMQLAYSGSILVWQHLFRLEPMLLILVVNEWCFKIAF